MRKEDWIRADQGLPNEGEDVLVYDDCFGIVVADYTKENGLHSYECGNLEQVTHWMPLILPQ